MLRTVPCPFNRLSKVVGPAGQEPRIYEKGNISRRKRKSSPRGLRINGVVSWGRILKARSHELGHVGKFTTDFIY